MRKRYKIISTCYDKRGNILASALNDYEKSNPWQKELSLKAGLSEHRICLHSEVHAILKSKGKRIHTLLIERYDNNGKAKLAFPCPSCQIAIKEVQIKKVMFTSEDGIQEWIV